MNPFISSWNIPVVGLSTFIFPPLSLDTCQQNSESRSDDMNLRSRPARVLLHKIDIEKKLFAEAHSAAGPETILIPPGDSKIIKYLILRENMPFVIKSQRKIEQQPVTIANRRKPQAGKLS